MQINNGGADLASEHLSSLTCLSCWPLATSDAGDTGAMVRRQCCSVALTRLAPIPEETAFSSFHWQSSQRRARRGIECSRASGRRHGMGASMTMR